MFKSKSLPYELVHMIGSYLDVWSLCEVRCVSKSTNVDFRKAYESAKSQREHDEEVREVAFKLHDEYREVVAGAFDISTRRFNDALKLFVEEKRMYEYYDINSRLVDVIEAFPEEPSENQLCNFTKFFTEIGSDGLKKKLLELDPSSLFTRIRSSCYEYQFEDLIDQEVDYEVLNEQVNDFLDDEEFLNFEGF